MLRELAKKMINGESEVGFEIGKEKYIADAANDDVLVECKSWGSLIYRQFQKIGKIENKKKVLMIHLPDVFDELWVIKDRDDSVQVDLNLTDEIRNKLREIDKLNKEVNKLTRQVETIKQKLKIVKGEPKRVLYLLPSFRFTKGEVDEDKCLICGERSDIIIRCADPDLSYGLCKKHWIALNEVEEK